MKKRGSIKLKSTKKKRESLKKQMKNLIKESIELSTLYNCRIYLEIENKMIDENTLLPYKEVVCYESDDKIKKEYYDKKGCGDNGNNISNISNISNINDSDKRKVIQNDEFDFFTDVKIGKMSGFHKKSSDDEESNDD